MAGFGTFIGSALVQIKVEQQVPRLDRACPAESPGPERPHFVDRASSAPPCNARCLQPSVRRCCILRAVGTDRSP